MDIKVKELINSALANIKEMVDANTVTGEPIVLANGVTIIPVSKVSCGFAAGGSDLPNKSEKEIFGGGTGGSFCVASGAEIGRNQSPTAPPKGGCCPRPRRQ